MTLSNGMNIESKASSFQLPLIHTPTNVYWWHENWALIPGTPESLANGRTHGVAVDRNNWLYIFHQAVPAMLVYDSGGILLTRWGNYPGAHGLTLVEEQGEELFWLTDQDRRVVEKTTKDGKVIGSVEPPDYATHQPYVPTCVAVNETRWGGNGDIWVADGYGSSRVNRYDSSGRHLMILDGTEGGGRFDCPHGVSFDLRKRPRELYIADRGNRRVQVYNQQGVFIRSFGKDFLNSPDGFAFDGESLIIPELKGRLTVLDINDCLIGHIGRNEEIATSALWPDKTHLQAGKFNSPHAAAVDQSRNLFVVEWRVGGRILKLEKI